MLQWEDVAERVQRNKTHVFYTKTNCRIWGDVHNET